MEFCSHSRFTSKELGKCFVCGVEICKDCGWKCHVVNCYAMYCTDHLEWVEKHKHPFTKERFPPVYQSVDKAHRLCSCFSIQTSKRVQRKNWKCPKCGSDPRFDEKTSAECKTCKERFHWCAFSENYQVGDIPDELPLETLKRMKTEAVMALVRLNPGPEELVKMKMAKVEKLG